MIEAPLPDLVNHDRVISLLSGAWPRNDLAMLSEHINHTWTVAKKDLYHLFGDKLKVSMPVCAPNSEEAAETPDRLSKREIKEILSLSSLDLGYVECGSCPVHGSDCDVSAFILADQPLPCCYALLEMVLVDYIFYNGFDTFALNAGPDGQKFVKWLKNKYRDQLLPNGKSLHAALPDHLSQVIQRYKSKSTDEIVISIDPYDYLTMSEASNWSSCHSLHGEYNTGTLSYMYDAVTVIAYKPSQPFTRYDNLIEGKTWRQVIHILPKQGLAVFGRQYPQERRDYFFTARKIVNYLLAAYHETDRRWILLKDLPDVTGHGLGFCETSSYGRATILKHGGQSTALSYGADCYCLTCGDKLHETGSLFCDDCDNSKLRCDECDSRIDPDCDHYITVDNYHYCENCGENYVMCQDCEEYYHHDNACRVASDNWVCECCYSNNYFTCDWCGGIEPDENGYHIADRDETWCADCLDNKGAVVCEECGDLFNSDYYVIGDDLAYCHSCSEELLFQCAGCGDMALQETGHVQDDRWYCENCQQKEC